MPAYVIVNVDVHDPDEYEEYKRAAAETVAAHQGRYLARGGRTRRLEGEWEPRRLVVLEFPSFEAAEAWYESEAYAGPREIRHRTATSDMVVVEGL